MKSVLVFFITCFITGFSVAQSAIDTTEIDSRYREDQFYASITYNILSNKPKGLSQSGFSSGFSLGFIRDMPINKQRNKAIGLGLGLSYSSYNQNLLIRDVSDNYTYTVLSGDDDQAYTKNKFSTYAIEVPLEYRWRTSTAESYKFWRIYPGFKFSYLLGNQSKHTGDLGEFVYTSNKDFNNLQYGFTMSAGYDNWNFNAYYGLNGIFNNDATIDGEKIDLSVIKIGLIFYIL
ncbi:porin family protein [Lacinutrix undariae]